MVGKLNISWTSFEHEIPNVITEHFFNEYKLSKDTKLFVLEFQFWKVFYVPITIIGVAILFAICDYASLLPRNGIIEIFESIYYVTAGIVLLSFIPSAISFLSAYFHTKAYVNDLNKSIEISSSYSDFCLRMSDVDKRYIMVNSRTMM
ncbi:MAG: hypothetical protein H7098_04775 [Oligoflexus sp.]|nr:hypothetical protein [Pseudopedobacter sp.]